jgi:hypothetical protein
MFTLRCRHADFVASVSSPVSLTPAVNTKLRISPRIFFLLYNFYLSIFIFLSYLPLAPSPPHRLLHLPHYLHLSPHRNEQKYIPRVATLLEKSPIYFAFLSRNGNMLFKKRGWQISIAAARELYPTIAAIPIPLSF